MLLLILFFSKPKPPKRKRRKHVNHIQATTENQSDEKIYGSNLPLWERKMHVIYLEEAQMLSPNLINMNESLYVLTFH